MVRRGFAKDRGEAQRLIIAGEVALADRRATSGGELVRADAVLHVARRSRFVSRGGEKLAGALADFGFDPTGLHCIDIGCSTGGFTDCLLQAGAASVVAVDVGYGDIAWSLRTDERVTVVERTNIRLADPVALGAPFDLAVSDVSHISLAAVLPTMSQLLGDAGTLITLIKPQFEAPRELVGNKGVVSDAATHIMVTERVLAAAEQVGLAPQGLSWSPILGAEGNMEFLLLARKGAQPAPLDIADMVARAHAELLG